MKNKGFTLIELLAVIVILAIIALIATPIILGIIKDSQNQANKRSLELYGRAIQNSVARAQLDGSPIEPGNLSSDFLSSIDYEGSRVVCTTNKLYSDGSIYLAGCSVNGNPIGFTYGKEPSENKKIVSILGDSISTLKGYIPSENRARYVQNLAEATGGLIYMPYEKTWWGGFIEDNDYILGFNDSWAGSRVSNSSNSNSGDIGPDRAMVSMTRINKLDDNGTPDIIFFFGGTNDIGAGVTLGTFNENITLDLQSTVFSDFATAYAMTILRLKSVYPNAEIISLLPTYTSSYYNNNSLTQYNNVIIQICEYYGVKYIDLRESGITTSNLVDGIHPNEQGMTLIKNYIEGENQSSPESQVQDVWYKQAYENLAVVNVNIAGRGWTYIDNNNFIDKPINRIEFYTNTEILNGEVTVSVVDRDTSAIIDSATGVYSKSGSQKELIIVNLSKSLIIQSGQCIAFFTQQSTNFDFMFANSPSGNGFIGRVPTVYGTGTAWTEYNQGDLNIGIGYYN